MKIGNRDFQTENKTYVMGILNVTPDSFSDGGKYNRLDAALYHAQEMIEEDADLLDIGGESTRPGHVQISDAEEIERAAPVLEAIKSRFEIPLSLDTYKSAVAEAGIAAGADLINDIWGLKYDRIQMMDEICRAAEKDEDRISMAAVIAAAGIPCCLMHNRSEAVYENYLPDVFEDLRGTVRIAKEAGIADDKIILDPGIGFGKTYEQNLIALKNLEKFHTLGYPLLLGTSKKSVIGLTLDVPADMRGAGTIATTVLGVQAGCMFVRVHNVRENVHAVRMTEAILSAQEVQNVY